MSFINAVPLQTVIMSHIFVLKFPFFCIQQMGYVHPIKCEEDMIVHARVNPASFHAKMNDIKSRSLAVHHLLHYWTCLQCHYVTITVAIAAYLWWLKPLNIAPEFCVVMIVVDRVDVGV